MVKYRKSIDVELPYGRVVQREPQKEFNKSSEQIPSYMLYVVVLVFNFGSL